MSGIRDTYPTWASVPAHVQRAVSAYDDARRQDSPWEWAMSERNKTSIAPMIEAAIEAAKPPHGEVGAGSGLAAADDNHKALVEALRTISSGTEDQYPPWRGMGSDQMQRVAREALAAFQSRQEGK